MIVTRTPLRISFFGGGSDLPAYYRKHGGAVLSSAFNRFMYIVVNPKFDRGVRVSYSQTEEVYDGRQLKHPLVRAVLEKLEVIHGIEIASIADIPSQGSGLGSSSSFTVGLLNAVHAYKNRFCNSQQLAQEACEIEIDICGAPIGKQDQYAAAYGGLNHIVFGRDGSVDLSPVEMPARAFRQLDNSLLLFYTGITRNASELLKKQSSAVDGDKKKQDILHEMVDLATEITRELAAGNLQGFGAAMHHSWCLKKSLTLEISTPQIDSWYDRAMKAGAQGGKLLGAGGGGFLLFYVDPTDQDSVIDHLSDLQHVDINLERGGSKVIVNI